MAKPRRRRVVWPDGYDPVQTQASLYKSALELIESKGFDGTSVAQIADHAGLTKGAFYHHFENKEDLLRTIHDEYVDAQLELVDRVLAEHSDPRDRLYQLIRASVLSIENFRANVTIFYQERRYLLDKGFEEVRVKRDRLESVFLDVIRQGTEEGVFGDGFDPQVTALGILGMCAWASQWFKSGGRLSAEQVADEFARLVLRGLETRDSA